jgi:hypothetical protein
MVVACSAIGAVGVRGAPELTLDEVGCVGLPRYPVVNVDGSVLVKAEDQVAGAPRDIHHREIATLILPAEGLLQGGPVGIRPPARSAGPGVTRTRSVRQGPRSPGAPARSAGLTVRSVAADSRGAPKSRRHV